MSDITEPDTLALLIVQQYLDEQGYMSGEQGGVCTRLEKAPVALSSYRTCEYHAALKEMERQQGLRYVPDKLPKGSMLLEVRTSANKPHIKYGMEAGPITKRVLWCRFFMKGWRGRLLQLMSQRLRRGRGLLKRKRVS